jgi:D-mannonate dehydratase
VELCTRTDFCGNDVERIIEYSIKLGIKYIWAFPEIKEHYDKDGLMDFDKLRMYGDRFEQTGLNIKVLSEIVNSGDLLSSDTVTSKAKRICQTIECMGKAGIGILFLFWGVEAPVNEKEHQQKWAYLANLVQRIIPCAENSKVKIASHGHQVRGYLVRGYKELIRVVSIVDSPYNGVAFCPGCHQLAGDDLYKCIHKFGQKIFFVHARNVIRKGIDKFEEVLFDRGEIDLSQIMKELKIIGYRGLICPEHLPHIAYQTSEEIEIAWGLGYLDCLLKGDG